MSVVICRSMCRDAKICKGMGRLGMSVVNWRCMVKKMVTSSRLDIGSIYRSSGCVNERLRRQIGGKCDRTSVEFGQELQDKEVHVCVERSCVN